MRFLCPICASPAWSCVCFVGKGTFTQTSEQTPVWSLGYHEAELRELVQRLKYRSETYLAEWLGAALRNLPAPWGTIEGLVPVPLHPLRLATRGYNQSALLARQVARGARKRVLFDAVERVIATRAQATLGAKERAQNVEASFSARLRLEPQRLLIVDDVVTTGSTAEAVKKAVEQAGATVVGVLSVSLARPKAG
jgi:ComF family protein